MERNLVPCWHWWRDRHTYNRAWRRATIVDGEPTPWKTGKHCGVCCLAEDFRDAPGESRWRAWRSARRTERIIHGMVDQERLEAKLEHPGVAQEGGPGS